jgi:hypothetical protein
VQLQTTTKSGAPLTLIVKQRQQQLAVCSVSSNMSITPTSLRLRVIT